jgi:predicted nucleic acid-binding protein
MSGAKAFLDTNIVIYAYDASAGLKHEIARQIMTDLWTSGNGILSTQVLQEFYVNVTRKIPKPLDTDLARQIVADLLKWDVVVNGGDSILDAIDIQKRHNFSFWDAMIISSAVTGGAVTLLSEELMDGQIIGGVTIRNPFTEKQGHAAV